jgi:hypothetical protein
MIINSNHKFANFIRPFMDGKELIYCISFDTDKNEAISLDINSYPFMDGAEFQQFTQVGKLTFKIKRGKNTPEPFFTELTTDKCFAGFVD